MENDFLTIEQIKKILNNHSITFENLDNTFMILDGGEWQIIDSSKLNSISKIRDFLNY